MTRRFSNILVALSMVFVALLAGDRSAQGQPASNAPTQLRVLWLDDPTTTATISWSTPSAGTQHEVRLDVTSRGGDPGSYSSSYEAAINGRYVSDGPYYHHAKIENLDPATEYYFVVVSDGEVSRELYFRTAPEDGRFKLLYGGDSRSDRENRQRMNRLIRGIFDTDPEVIGLVHGGDYIEWANTWWQWTAWLDDHQLTFTADGRVLPIVPAKGNHEGRGTVYNRVFGFPGGDAEKNYFTLNFGSRLALINLDTEVSMAGDQKTWLREQLEAAQHADWVVANYHRPAFPAFKTPSGAREHFVPLFEEFNLDLACESDGHTLKRTVPIRNEQLDFTGVVYVGEGGLGVRQRTPDLDRWYLKSPGMAASAHHVQIISVGEELLTYEAVLEDGTVADMTTIQNRHDRTGGRITLEGASASSPWHVRLELTRPFDPDSLGEASFTFDNGVNAVEALPGDVVKNMLAVANEASLEELDEAAALDVRAARNILSWRNGLDGIEGTADDREFRTYFQLDEVPWMGPVGLENLARYAVATREAGPNVITIWTSGFEDGELYHLGVDDLVGDNGSTIPAGTTVPFRYGGPDTPADSIGNKTIGPDQPETAASCSSAPLRRAPTALVFIIFLGGFMVLRRRS